MVRFTGDKASIDALFEDQLISWDLAREYYSGLQHLKVKTVLFNDFEWKVQFNPNRIISSSANVDMGSINERPCFLCAHNRPFQQQGLQYADEYLLLVNPYPVFIRHLTIPLIQHSPQRIIERFGTMLDLAMDMPDFMFIYNGPACGASAPDHFHFQAIMQGILPIELHPPPGKPWVCHGVFQETELYTCEKYPGKAITFIGSQKAVLVYLFERLYKQLAKRLQTADEPMMNILTRYSFGNWIVHVFPRRKHRPAQYFEQGEKQLLLSPASIDMGGVLIMPRENDYHRLTRADIEDVFMQVCADDDFILDMIHSLLH